MPPRKRSSSSSSTSDESPAHRSSSHRTNNEKDKKRSRRSSSRDKHKRDGKSSKKHAKKSSKSHRSPVRDSSSATDKERKLPQTSTSQTTPASTAANEPLDKEAEQKRLEEEMQKRKNRIEQWRAERRTMLGIDKVIQQSAAQIAKGKAWSLEDEGDEEEEDLQNVVMPTTDIKRDVAAAREALLSSQADKQREALERAAEAAAIASAACAANAAKLEAEQDDDDPLDKFMETIAKEVKSFRGQNATIVSTKSNENNTKGIKQEQTSNNGKASVIKVITKKFNSESAGPTLISNNGTLPTTNGHHTNVSAAKPEPMDTTDQSSAVTSRVSVRSGVAKRAKEKGLIMEQDIDGLEYSSEEETAKPAEEFDELFAMSTKKSKADMITTNHEKIYYRPFRKNFYTVVPEIACMTELEVAAYREELDGIKVTGKRCPRPIKAWSQCITSDKILQCLKKSNYERPTPIQAQALSIILSGRDMIGIAKTGSGKTLAFLLPLFRHIKDQPPLEGDDGPIAIIMTPTRELALQTTKECKKFSKLFDIRCVAVYGGTGISEQIAELKRGAEIIVCTPGRMIDMLAANGGKVTNVRRVTYVVVDEADRMFDMGFEPQVMKILDSIRPDRQTVMFSATFPKQMEALARKTLHKPIEVMIGGRSSVCEDVEQNVVILDDDQKYLKLLELLGIYQPQGSVIVFVDKQEHCDELMKNLLRNSYPCMSLHGGIDQYDRDSTMVDFKRGDMPLMIATSVAARGLDVKDLILVVNYDCPNHYEDYVHRCGRTGRAGNKGFAYTFITPAQERHACDIIRAFESSGTTVPEDLRLLWDGYTKKMEAMGKKVKTTGGFSGHGYKFDSSETQLKDEQKKMQKLVMGLADSDEDEESQDIDQQIQSLFNSKKSVKAKGDAPVLPNAPAAQNEDGSGSTAANDTASKFEKAKQLAARLTFTKAETRDSIQEATTSLFQRGGTLNPAVSSRIVAQQRAGELNQKLNYQKPEEEVQVTEDAFKIFEEELEINDFPQNARWKVTSKETLAHICDYADVGMSVRGQYYPNNKEVAAGDRKLYLQIESLTERGLQLAKAEVARLIKEEMMKMQNPALQLVNRGRYKVI
ncbi:unnamed protein product [Rotaria socialis]|uniref:Probable ATP-dependent RNA helicase DDX46 n=1 Tax=Rotaria socialis TaxID=392032 RepID=A0A818GV80_9BILA|nr:unnamed protein product [Rotaria socialis]CAF3698467.1 unnamed protein product [Rotaria socialis]CAF4383618.1 unnamed protein product [Rotaria socialis]CAF4593462.1 unnamed protein product [Rotaria socialis]